MAPYEPEYIRSNIVVNEDGSPQQNDNGIMNRQPPVEKLFDSKYLRQPMSSLDWIILILYTPIGCILAFVRVLLTAVLCLYATISEKYLPWKISDRTLFRLICYIAGVFVRKIEGKLPTEKELAHSFVVSNHTMTGDPGVLYHLYHRNAKVVHKSNVGSFDIITRHKVLVGEDKAQVRTAILNEVESDPTPIVIYPEGATTNGNVGLLRFSSFIFSLGRPIHPVGVKYSPALPFIPFHAIMPNYTFHMFLVGFQPFVLVDIHVLPRQEKGPSETPESFAERVQKQIASAINVAPTPYTASDKSKLRKSMSSKNL